MARIAFFTYQYPGPFNASRRLAADLKKAGHDVRYVGMADAETLARTSGLPFIRVFEEWFPEGYAERKRSEPRGGVLGKLAAARRRGAELNNFLDALIDGRESSFARFMNSFCPEMVIIPSCYFESIAWALLVHAAGSQVVYLTSIFLRPQDRFAAPFNSAEVPDGTLWSDLRVSAAWWKAQVRYGITQRMNRIMGGVNWAQSMRRLADTCGYPANLMQLRDAYTLRIAAPELVVYPQAFDLPGGGRPGRVYASPAIDLDREETAFPWERLAPGLPVVYCALGTQSYLTPAVRKRFFEQVIECARQLEPQHQFVIAVGDAAPPQEFDAPANVVVVDQAPQLALLRTAVAAIIHGGVNSLKECAWFGVPVIVFPMAFDQPSSVARVEYHGLGLSGDVHSANATDIRKLLETVLRTPFFRIQAERMSVSLRDSEEHSSSLDAAQELLRSKKAVPHLAAFGS